MAEGSNRMKRVDYKAGKSGVPFYGYIHEDFTELGGMYKERPAVIVLPGGGYIKLSPREEDPVVFSLFARGYNVFVLRYSVGDRIASPSYPEEEVAAAVSILKERSRELSIMPDAIFTLGFSAGGHAAASEACHWEKFGEKARPDGVILCYPVITMGEKGHQGSTDSLTHGNAALISYYSLETQVKETIPPVFIWHTASDASVPVENSLMFASSLIEHNAKLEMHIFPNGVHGLSTGKREVGKEEKRVQCWMDLACCFVEELTGFRG